MGDDAAARASFVLSVHLAQPNPGQLAAQFVESKAWHTGSKLRAVVAGEDFTGFGRIGHLLDHVGGHHHHVTGVDACLAAHHRNVL